jgi:hypothetical protein
VVARDPRKPITRAWEKGADMAAFNIAPSAVMAPSAVLAVLKAGDRVEVDFTAAGALQHRLTATLLAVDQHGVAVREVRDTDQIDRFI